MAEIYHWYSKYYFSKCGILHTYYNASIITKIFNNFFKWVRMPKNTKLMVALLASRTPSCKCMMHQAYSTLPRVALAKVASAGTQALVGKASLGVL